ncbi:PIN domain-like protein, partial [Mycena crocata]
IIEPALQRRSFEQLCLSEGFNSKRHRDGMLRIGIDASIWLAECTQVFQGQYRRENPQLEALLYKLCELIKYCAIAIFVFDGPGRPVKRGKEAAEWPGWLLDHFKTMITAFGFYYYTAPGEAEAELAQLNRMKLVDAIFTTDGDVLVFGATHMILRHKDEYKSLKIYTSKAIESRLRLNLGGLLLMAILVGGDYNKVIGGLDKCAKETAYTLTKRGLGDSLLLATQTLSPDGLHGFLETWRQTLCTELVSGQSGRKHPAIARGVTNLFPDPRVLHLYVHPLTSWSSDGAGIDASTWVPRLPDLPAIARICEVLFSWGTKVDLPNKLFNNVLPGLCIRRLAKPVNQLESLQRHFRDTYDDDNYPQLSIFLSIKMFCSGHFRVEVSTRTFLASIQNALTGVHNRPDRSAVLPFTTIIMPVPPSILFHALPMMVEEYERRTHRLNNAYRAEDLFEPVRKKLFKSTLNTN